MFKNLDKSPVDKPCKNVRIVQSIHRGADSRQAHHLFTVQNRSLRMKHSLKISKPIQYVSMILLMLALVFSAFLIAASPVQASTSEGNATSIDSAKIKATIQSYFTQRYETQKAFLSKPTNYSAMYSASVVANADPVWTQ